jgi:hypothetical protein
LISGGVLVLSFSSCSFHDFAVFRAFLLASVVLLLLGDLLSFSLLFGLLSVLHGVLDSNFKFCVFVVNGLIKGEIEKPSNQFLGSIVMSH